MKNRFAVRIEASFYHFRDRCQSKMLKCYEALQLPFTVSDFSIEFIFSVEHDNGF